MKRWWWRTPFWSPAVLVPTLESLRKDYKKKEAFLLPSSNCLWFFFFLIVVVFFTGMCSSAWEGGSLLAVRAHQKLRIQTLPHFVSNSLYCQFSRFFKSHWIVYNCTFCVKRAENSNWTCPWSSSCMFFVLYWILITSFTEFLIFILHRMYVPICVTFAFGHYLLIHHYAFFNLLFIYHFWSSCA